MKSAIVVSVLATAFIALSSQACTLGSDTYITSEPGIASSGAKDAGAKTDASSSSSSSASSSGGACSFVAPDVSKLTPCGGGKGHCFDKSKTPKADMLGACADASEVCVPDEVLAAAGKPLKSCTSGVGDGGACITMALIPAMEADDRAKQFLKQDVCDAGQICAPCINPLDGNAPTGLCDPVGVYGECSSGSAPASDAGSAAKPLPTCCSHGSTSSGVCIAASLVPEDQRSDAPRDSCSAGNLCAPKAFVENAPVKCNGGLLGGGVCLDTCFNEMMGFASSIGILGKDRCADTEVCVPCTFLSGKGVPGCE